MKNLIKEAYLEAKNLPKGLWITAIIVPGGIATLTVYVAGKTAFNKLKKKEIKND